MEFYFYYYCGFFSFCALDELAINARGGAHIILLEVDASSGQAGGEGLVAAAGSACIRRGGLEKILARCFSLLFLVIVA